MTSGAVATFSAPSGSTRYKGHGVLNCLPTPTILPLPLPSLSLSYATLLALLIICCCFLKCGHYWRRRGCRECRGCQGCLGLGSGGGRRYQLRAARVVVVVRCGVSSGGAWRPFSGNRPAGERASPPALVSPPKTPFYVARGEGGGVDAREKHPAEPSRESRDDLNSNRIKKGKRKREKESTGKGQVLS